MSHKDPVSVLALVSANGLMPWSVTKSLCRAGRVAATGKALPVRSRTGHAVLSLARTLRLTALDWISVATDLGKVTIIPGRKCIDFTWTNHSDVSAWPTLVRRLDRYVRAHHVPRFHYKLCDTPSQFLPDVPLDTPGPKRPRGPAATVYDPTLVIPTDIRNGSALYYLRHVTPVQFMLPGSLKRPVLDIITTLLSLTPSSATVTVSAGNDTRAVYTTTLYHDKSRAHVKGAVTVHRHSDPATTTPVPDIQIDRTHDTGGCDDDYDDNAAYLQHYKALCESGASRRRAKCGD